MTHHQAKTDATAPPARGYGYVRVSTNKQDCGMEVQTEGISRACQYILNAGIDDTFTDPDTSGSTPFTQREGAQRLLARIQADLAEGCAPTICCAKVDRLGRDTVDVSNTATLFDQLGIRLVLLDINVDTRTAMGRAFMQIAAVFAELERARIRERIQTTLDLKRSQGLVTGTVPYGWDGRPTGAVGKNGKPIRELVPNEAEQQVILDMARMRAGGASWSGIATLLNQNHVPTKRQGESLNMRQIGGGNGVSRASGLWEAGNVQGVLTNKTTTAFLSTHELGTGCWQIQ
jgi:DNA invertase Pin-like site-specific DNA recombinase